MPLTAAFDTSGAQFVWDASSLELTSCLRKYRFRMIEGWEPRSLSDDLLFGKVFASSQEHFWRARFSGASHVEALRAVLRHALSETVGWATLNERKNRSNLLRTLVWYFDEYRDDTLAPIALSDGRPAVELSFSLELGPDTIWRGHLDRLSSFHGDTVILDQKTTGSWFSQSYFEAFNLDNQMSGYALAGRIVFDLPISHIIIDAASITPTRTDFARFPTLRTEAFLDEWRTVTLDRVAAVRQATLDECFPPNYSQCRSYGGCAFRTICSEPASLRPALLAQDFIPHRPWDPSKDR